MTPEETAKLIVEEFNGHTFFMESMAQEWLAKRIAEGIRKHVDDALKLEADKRGFTRETSPVIYEATKDFKPIEIVTDSAKTMKAGPFEVGQFSSEQGKKYEVKIEDGKIVSAKEKTDALKKPKPRQKRA